MNRRKFLHTSAGASLLPLTVTPASLAAASAPSYDTAPPPASVDAPLVTSAAGRERLLLDFGWRFHLGNADDPKQDFDYGLKGGSWWKTGLMFRPARPDFDVSGWQAVDLPHDWAVALPFHNDPVLTTHGSKPLGRKYPATSIGWYRREFNLTPADRGRRLRLEFDGVFRNCMVVLNGCFLGRNLSGYAPFSFDITDFAHYDGKNVLVVRADATESEGWFYEGAGIYRHVWLVKTHSLHVPQWGVYTRAKVSRIQGGHGAAELELFTEVENAGPKAARAEVVSVLRDPAGKVVARRRSSVQLRPWSQTTVRQAARLARAELWSVETPHLYQLETTLEHAGRAVDQLTTPCGIRHIRFTADHGFFLNGRHVELHGMCNHQDHAGVGSALPDRLQYYRIEKLKGMGVNAYRTSHNPPTPELLDACDRLGMLVMDETRMFSSDPEGLSQLSRLVRRDRNRPSVVMWSMGNEEWFVQAKPLGERIAASMKRLIRRLDPTRPATQAMNIPSMWGHGVSHVDDLQGFNYGGAKPMDAFHAKFPKKPCFGSETGSTVSTRGEYVTSKKLCYVSAYDVNRPPWAQLAEQWWGDIYAKRPYLAGGFVWTGFDYRGEPTPYGWPCINSHFGQMDVCGFPKDDYYYYQAAWSGHPVLHLFPHWNWAGQEGKPVSVWVYSNLDAVELFLNGKSQGRQDVVPNQHLQWQVAWAPGTIEAVGYKNGRRFMTARRETTGAAARILLRPDRASIAGDGEDVVVVEAHVLDSVGRLMPTADHLIQFEVSGPGHIIGVGNGNPTSHEPDKASRRKAFNGLCVAIVQARQAAGALEIRASSPGLRSAAARVNVSAAGSRALI